MHLITTTNPAGRKGSEFKVEVLSCLIIGMLNRVGDGGGGEFYKILQREVCQRSLGRSTGSFMLYSIEQSINPREVTELFSLYFIMGWSELNTYQRILLEWGV